MLDSLELLTVKEVARLLRLSTRQVWKLAGEKRLPEPVRLRRSVRWRAADLKRFLDSGADMAAYEDSLSETTS